MTLQKVVPSLVGSLIRPPKLTPNTWLMLGTVRGSCDFQRTLDWKHKTYHTLHVVTCPWHSVLKLLNLVISWMYNRMCTVENM